MWFPEKGFPLEALIALALYPVACLGGDAKPGTGIVLVNYLIFLGDQISGYMACHRRRRVHWR